MYILDRFLVLAMYRNINSIDYISFILTLNKKKHDRSHQIYATTRQMCDRVFYIY